LWLTVSEGVDHGHLALHFWAYCEVEHGSRSRWRRQRRIQKGAWEYRKRPGQR
jgi:hypothetical protein